MERFNPDYAGFCISTRNEQDVERRCQGFNPDYAGFCISTATPSGVRVADQRHDPRACHRHT